MTRTTLTKITAVLVALLIMIPFAAFSTSAAITPTAGWGDPDGDGVFEVGSAEDFFAMAAQRAANGNYAGKTIKLTADIDLNPGWDAKSGTAPENAWAPLWTFDGNIDGNGHTISGIYVTGTNNTGFARATTKAIEIKDLAIVNSVFGGDGTNCSFIGDIGADIKFTNVYMEAIVNNPTSYAGGFLANVKSGKTATFENCVFNGTVSSTSNHIGGFVGFVNGGTANFTNCASFGATSSTSGLASGFCATNGAATVTFTNCLANTNSTAAFASAAFGSPAITLADCYVVGTATPVAIAENETPPTPTITITYAGAAADAVATKAAAELDMADYTDTCKDIYVPTSIAALLSINHVDANSDNKCDNAGCDYTYPTVTPDEDDTTATPDDDTTAAPDDTTTTPSSPSTGDTTYLYLLVAVIAVVGCVAVVSKSKNN